jgi:hypothetical protein
MCQATGQHDRSCRTGFLFFLLVPLAILIFTGSWLSAGIAFFVAAIALNSGKGRRGGQGLVRARCPRCASQGRLGAAYCHSCGAQLAPTSHRAC